MRRQQKTLNVEAGPRQVLKLSGALRIQTAAELRAALRDLISTASRPVVDLSAVSECDTACLQLLISARRTAEHADKPFEFIGRSVAVQEAAAALGALSFLSTG